MPVDGPLKLEPGPTHDETLDVPPGPCPPRPLSGYGIGDAVGVSFGWGVDSRYMMAVNTSHDAAAGLPAPTLPTCLQMRAGGQ